MEDSHVFGWRKAYNGTENIKNCVLTRKSEKSLIYRRNPQWENIIIIIVMMDNNYFSVVVVVVEGAAAAAAMGVTIIVFSFGKNLLLKSDTSKFQLVYDCLYFRTVHVVIFIFSNQLMRSF